MSSWSSTILEKHDDAKWNIEEGVMRYSLWEIWAWCGYKNKSMIIMIKLSNILKQSRWEMDLRDDDINSLRLTEEKNFPNFMGWLSSFCPFICPHISSSTVFPDKRMLNENSPANKKNPKGYAKQFSVELLCQSSALAVWYGIRSKKSNWVQQGG